MESPGKQDFKAVIDSHVRTQVGGSIKQLPSLLQEDELLLMGIAARNSERDGLLAMTERRIIFVAKGMFTSLKVDDIHYDNIVAVGFEPWVLTIWETNSIVPATGQQIGIKHDFKAGTEIGKKNKEELRGFADKLWEIGLPSAEATERIQSAEDAKAEAIESHLQRIGVVNRRLLARGEMKKLRDILWDNELPEKVITGRYEGKWGVLVATDRRVIFIDKGLFSLTIEDFSYDRITSIESSTGVIHGSLTIYTSGNKEKFDTVPNDELSAFADHLRGKVRNLAGQNAASASTATPIAPTPNLSVAEELEKMASLLEKGILTQEEFDAQKAKLLR